MDGRHVQYLAERELSDALRNRWFLLYTVLFALMATGLSWVGASGASTYGVSVFGRTAASLVNLVLLVVPLMGLSLGALSLAQERDRGTLLYLMAQPVSSAEVLLGKLSGLLVSLSGCILIGFGVSGLVIAAVGGTANAAAYLQLVGLSVLLAAVTAAFGLWISAAVREASVAVGTAVFLWLTLIVLGDLGLMGSALVLELSTGTLLALTLVTPLQVFKLGGLLALRGDLDQLGAAGALAVDTFGAWLPALLVGLLLVWGLAATVGAYWTFRRRGVV